MANEQSHATSEAEAQEWRTAELDDLCDTLLTLEDRDELERFLRDLCTLSELRALAHRWEVAKLLEERLPYHEISRRTGASTTTVTRVAHWLRFGEGGYRLALARRPPRGV